MIGLAGYVYLQCDNSFLGAFLFSVGLLSVLIFNCNLYTGKVCNPDYILKPIYLAICFIGNFIGAAYIAGAVFFSSDVHGKAVLAMTSKLAKTNRSLIYDGGICGLFIAIAVVGYKLTEGFGKYLMVVLGVMCFILCGSEHVVADCFYAVLAHTGSVMDNIRVIGLVLLGNAIGGVLSTWLTGQYDEKTDSFQQGKE